MRHFQPAAVISATVFIYEPGLSETVQLLLKIINQSTDNQYDIICGTIFIRL